MGGPRHFFHSDSITVDPSCKLQTRESGEGLPRGQCERTLCHHTLMKLMVPSHAHWTHGIWEVLRGAAILDLCPCITLYPPLNCTLETLGFI